MVTLSAHGARQALDNLVNNEGVVKASQIKQQGGNVFLTGGSVTNNGLVNITNEGGDSGRVTITANQVVHSGTINANNSQGKAGEVVLSAAEELEVTGNISANGKQGGVVKLLADKVEVHGNSTIEAKGELAGGEILVGGNYQGKGPEKNSKQTTVGERVTLDTSVTSNGNGGKIIVWADDITKFSGKVVSRGGEKRGNGGFIEVSGKERLVFRGKVDTKAKHGKNGQLLLDPAVILISDEEQSSSSSEIITITTETLENISDTDITLDATIAVIAEGIASGKITLHEGTSLKIKTKNNFKELSWEWTRLWIDWRGTAEEYVVYNNQGEPYKPGIDLSNIDIVASGDGSVSLYTGNNDQQDQLGGVSASIKVGNITTEDGDVLLVSNDVIELYGSIKTSSGDITLKAQTGKVKGNTDNGIIVKNNVIISSSTGDITATQGEVKKYHKLEENYAENDKYMFESPIEDARVKNIIYSEGQVVSVETYGNVKVDGDIDVASLSIKANDAQLAAVNTSIGNTTVLAESIKISGNIEAERDITIQGDSITLDNSFNTAKHGKIYIEADNANFYGDFTAKNGIQLIANKAQFQGTETNISSTNGVVDFSSVRDLLANNLLFNTFGNDIKLYRLGTEDSYISSVAFLSEGDKSSLFLEDAIYSDSFDFSGIDSIHSLGNAKVASHSKLDFSHTAITGQNIAVNSDKRILLGKVDVTGSAKIAAGDVILTNDLVANEVDLSATPYLSSTGKASIVSDSELDLSHTQLWGGDFSIYASDTIKLGKVGSETNHYVSLDIGFVNQGENSLLLTDDISAESLTALDSVNDIIIDSAISLKLLGKLDTSTANLISTSDLFIHAYGGAHLGNIDVGGNLKLNGNIYQYANIKANSVDFSETLQLNLQGNNLSKKIHAITGGVDLSQLNIQTGSTQHTNLKITSSDLIKLGNIGDNNKNISLSIDAQNNPLSLYGKLDLDDLSLEGVSQLDVNNYSIIDVIDNGNLFDFSSFGIIGSGSLLINQNGAALQLGRVEIDGSFSTNGISNLYITDNITASNILLNGIGHLGIKNPIDGSGDNQTYLPVILRARKVDLSDKTLTYSNSLVVSSNDVQLGVVGSNDNCVDNLIVKKLNANEQLHLGFQGDIYSKQLDLSQVNTIKLYKSSGLVTNSDLLLNEIDISGVEGANFHINNQSYKVELGNVNLNGNLHITTSEMGLNNHLSALEGIDLSSVGSIYLKNDLLLDSGAGDLNLQSVPVFGNNKSLGLKSSKQIMLSEIGAKDESLRQLYFGDGSFKLLLKDSNIFVDTVDLSGVSQLSIEGKVNIDSSSGHGIQNYSKVDVYGLGSLSLIAGEGNISLGNINIEGDFLSENTGELSLNSDIAANSIKFNGDGKLNLNQKIVLSANEIDATNKWIQGGHSLSLISNKLNLGKIGSANNYIGELILKQLDTAAPVNVRLLHSIYSDSLHTDGLLATSESHRLILSNNSMLNVSNGINLTPFFVSSGKNIDWELYSNNDIQLGILNLGGSLFAATVGHIELNKDITATTLSFDSHKLDLVNNVTLESTNGLIDLSKTHVAGGHAKLTLNSNNKEVILGSVGSVSNPLNSLDFLNPATLLDISGDLFINQLHAKNINLLTVNDQASINIYESDLDFSTVNITGSDSLSLFTQAGDIQLGKINVGGELSVHANKPAGENHITLTNDITASQGIFFEGSGFVNLKPTAADTMVLNLTTNNEKRIEIADRILIGEAGLAIGASNILLNQVGSIDELFPALRFADGYTNQQLTLNGSVWTAGDVDFSQLNQLALNQSNYTYHFQGHNINLNTQVALANNNGLSFSAKSLQLGNLGSNLTQLNSLRIDSVDHLTLGGDIYTEGGLSLVDIDNIDLSRNTWLYVTGEDAILTVNNTHFSGHYFLGLASDQGDMNIADVSTDGELVLDGKKKVYLAGDIISKQGHIKAGSYYDQQFIFTDAIQFSAYGDVDLSRATLIASTPALDLTIQSQTGDIRVNNIGSATERFGKVVLDGNVLLNGHLYSQQFNLLNADQLHTGTHAVIDFNNGSSASLNLSKTLISGEGLTLATGQTDVLLGNVAFNDAAFNLSTTGNVALHGNIRAHQGVSIHAAGISTENAATTPLLIDANNTTIDLANADINGVDTHLTLKANQIKLGGDNKQINLNELTFEGVKTASLAGHVNTQAALNLAEVSDLFFEHSLTLNSQAHLDLSNTTLSGQGGLFLKANTIAMDQVNTPQQLTELTIDANKASLSGNLNVADQLNFENTDIYLSADTWIENAGVAGLNLSSNNITGNDSLSLFTQAGDIQLGEINVGGELSVHANKPPGESHITLTNDITASQGIFFKGSGFVNLKPTAADTTVLNLTTNNEKRIEIADRTLIGKVGLAIGASNILLNQVGRTDELFPALRFADGYANQQLTLNGSIWTVGDVDFSQLNQLVLNQSDYTYHFQGHNINLNTQVALANNNGLNFSAKSLQLGNLGSNLTQLNSLRIDSVDHLTLGGNIYTEGGLSLVDIDNIDLSRNTWLYVTGEDATLTVNNTHFSGHYFLGLASDQGDMNIADVSTDGELVLDGKKKVYLAGDIISKQGHIKAGSYYDQQFIFTDAIQFSAYGDVDLSRATLLASTPALDLTIQSQTGDIRVNTIGSATERFGKVVLDGNVLLNGHLYSQQFNLLNADQLHTGTHAVIDFNNGSSDALNLSKTMISGEGLTLAAGQTDVLLGNVAFNDAAFNLSTTGNVALHKNIKAHQGVSIHAAGISTENAATTHLLIDANNTTIDLANTNINGNTDINDIDTHLTLKASQIKLGGDNKQINLNQLTLDGVATASLAGNIKTQTALNLSEVSDLLIDHTLSLDSQTHLDLSNTTLSGQGGLFLKANTIAMDQVNTPQQLTELTIDANKASLSGNLNVAEQLTFAKADIYLSADTRIENAGVAGLNLSSNNITGNDSLSLFTQAGDIQLGKLNVGGELSVHANKSTGESHITLTDDIIASQGIFFKGSGFVNLKPTAADTTVLNLTTDNEKRIEIADRALIGEVGLAIGASNILLNQVGSADQLFPALRFADGYTNQQLTLNGSVWTTGDLDFSQLNQLVLNQSDYTYHFQGHNINLNTQVALANNNGLSFSAKSLQLGNLGSNLTQLNSLRIDSVDHLTLGGDIYTEGGLSLVDIDNIDLSRNTWLYVTGEDATLTVNNTHFSGHYFLGLASDQGDMNIADVSTDGELVLDGKKKVYLAGDIISKQGHIKAGSYYDQQFIFTDAIQFSAYSDVDLSRATLLASTPALDLTIQSQTGDIRINTIGSATERFGKVVLDGNVLLNGHLYSQQFNLLNADQLHTDTHAIIDFNGGSSDALNLSKTMISGEGLTLAAGQTDVVLGNVAFNDAAFNLSTTGNVALHKNIKAHQGVSIHAAGISTENAATTHLLIDANNTIIDLANADINGMDTHLTLKANQIKLGGDNKQIDLNELAFDGVKTASLAGHVNTQVALNLAEVSDLFFEHHLTLDSQAHLDLSNTSLSGQGGLSLKADTIAMDQMNTPQQLTELTIDANKVSLSGNLNVAGQFSFASADIRLSANTLIETNGENKVDLGNTSIAGNADLILKAGNQAVDIGVVDLNQLWIDTSGLITVKGDWQTQGDILLTQPGNVELIGNRKIKSKGNLFADEKTFVSLGNLDLQAAETMALAELTAKDITINSNKLNTFGHWQVNSVKVQASTVSLLNDWKITAKKAIDLSKAAIRGNNGLSLTANEGDIKLGLVGKEITSFIANTPNGLHLNSPLDISGAIDVRGSKQVISNNAINLAGTKILTKGALLKATNKVAINSSGLALLGDIVTKDLTVEAGTINQTGSTQANQLVYTATGNVNLQGNYQLKGGQAIVTSEQGGITLANSTNLTGTSAIALNANGPVNIGQNVNLSGAAASLTSKNSAVKLGGGSEIAVTDDIVVKAKSDVLLSKLTADEVFVTADSGSIYSSNGYTDNNITARRVEFTTFNEVGTESSPLDLNINKELIIYYAQRAVLNGIFPEPKIIGGSTTVVRPYLSMLMALRSRLSPEELRHLDLSLFMDDFSLVAFGDDDLLGLSRLDSLTFGEEI